MVRYLSHYKGPYRIFTVSKNKEMTEQLLAAGLTVGEISEDTLTILPDNIAVTIASEEKARFSVFAEGDVVEINERGILYRWYSVVEGDAGIATTSHCNSNCIMCPASESERRLANNISLPQLDTVLKHMPKDLWYFTVTGGEPTLIGEDKFLHVMRSVKRELPHTRILLLTNGRTLGDRDFFARFAQTRPNHLRIAIPIHGSTAQKHDYITQSPGGFRQTMRGISNILHAHIELELRIVVSKLNCDDVTNIAKLIIRYFPTTTVVNFVGLEMRGNCVANADQVRISYQDAFQKSKEAIRLLIHHGIDVGLYNFPYCMIDEEYWPIAQKSISAYKSMFYDACEQCRLRHECCGIFLATMNFYKPKVYPITSGDQYDKLL